MSVFVNHSNHPSGNWSSSQLEAALVYGAIIDVGFPEIHAYYDEKEISDLVKSMFSHIVSLDPAAVLCQGEFTYTYGMVRLLKDYGIPVLAACSERVAFEEWDGDVSRKVSYFNFVRFRMY